VGFFCNFTIVKNIFYIFIFLSFSSFSQNEGNIWYFGNGAGLDFNSGSPVALTDGMLNTREGCATISDNNGDLLFYTDGMLVYNKNHTIMPNGSGLLGHNSSTQSSIIVKKPGSSTRYYIFTVDCYEVQLNGLRYSEVDMTLDGGLGDVVAINKNILLVLETLEKITAIKHQNGYDFWIISRLDNSNTYHSYLLTSTGLNMTPVISNIGPNYSADIGQLKGSPDGTKIAAAMFFGNGDFNIIDFDNLTGGLNNPTTINISGGLAYGIEFSPNSSIVYISDYSSQTVYQYDLLTSSLLAISTGNGNGSLQLAPDGKIYLADENNLYLHVISSPNTVGLGCSFIPNAVFLSGRVCRLGLPTFYSSIFLPPVDTCFIPQANLPDTMSMCDTSITLTADPAFTYLWSTGETTQSIVVNQSGDYWVQVCDATVGEVLVYENDFDSFIGSEWSDNTTSTYNSTAILGNFNNASTTLTLNNLPTHNSIKAVFDLYLLDSWDGNAGPDIWDLSIDGSSTINTTFSNVNFGGGMQQSYPGNYPSANAPLTDVNQMGLPNICYTGINSISSLYKIDSPFSTHSATSASIDFSASGLESSCNESWAIDSLRIYVDSALSCCATEFVHVELTAPNANLGPDIFTCDSLVTLTASGGYTYLWSTGETTQSIIVDTTGNYQVMICDSIPSNQYTLCFPNPDGTILIGAWSWSYKDLIIPAGFKIDAVFMNADRPGYSASSHDFSMSYCPNSTIYNSTNEILIIDYSVVSTSMYNTWIDVSMDNVQSTGMVRVLLPTGTSAIWYDLCFSLSEACCALEDINIQIKCPPTTVVITDPSCNGYADGSIDLTFVDGTLPQTIVWESSDNTFLSNMPHITSLIAGEYIVSTTCGLTCPPVIDTIIVPEPPALIVPAITSDISCVGLNDGSVDIIISALVPLVLSTEWTGPNSFISILEDINSLSAGLYSVLVTNVNNCFITQDFEVKEPDSILSNPTITNISCNGFSDGTASLSITGGITPYTIIWGTSDPLNLYAGTHTYTITDSNNCVFIADLIILEPESISTNISTTDVLCYGDSTGTAVVSPTGGVNPYNINWGISNPSSLAEGLYIYTITDNNNCTYLDTVNISQPDPIAVSSNQENVSCYGGYDGWGTVSVTGGIAPYIVDWYGTDSLLLSAGTYLYSVSDLNNCTLIDSLVITQPDSLNVTYTTTNVQCYQESTGDIDVSVLLVNPAYSYLWTNATNPNFIETTEDISNLYAGTYLLTVTDADLCAIELQIVVNEPTPISEFISIQASNYTGYHIACKGDSSGWINLEIDGGYIPFTYAWNTGETTDSISNLDAGIYTSIITDALGCTETVQLNLLEPATNLTGLIQVTTDYNGFNISCFNGSDGGVREIPSGGVSPYAWIWDGIQGGEYAINQIAGYHHVELYDNNNCFWEDSITLTEPPPLDIQHISVTDTCDRAVGEISVNVTGGLSPYTYLWSSGQTLDSVNNLTEGMYIITSTDANSCEILESILVLNLQSPEADFNTFPEHRRYYDQLDKPFFFIDISNTYWQNVVNWQWDFGDNTFGEDSIASHSYAEAGEYTILLAIETQYNCWDTISKKILIDEYALYIPNTFTPNTDDDLNNEFKPYGYGVKAFKMMIFNRWGELIFTSEDLDIGWDGKKEGEDKTSPLGVYVYYIEVENIYGEIFKYEGTLNLIR